jgi:hypothetical protein
VERNFKAKSCFVSLEDVHFFISLSWNVASSRNLKKLVQLLECRWLKLNYGLHIARISIFGFGPKLVPIGQCFRLFFRCLAYSPKSQRALYK